MNAAGPDWLLTLTVLAIHDAVLSEHGGMPGLRRGALLESALGRPKHLLAYEGADVFALAACYAAGIAKNSPFSVGNKRTGFVAAYTFLRINGFQIRAREEQVVLQMVGLVTESVSEADFARWLEESCVDPT